MKLYCFKVIFQTFSYLYAYYSIFIHKDNKMSINFVRDLKKETKLKVSMKYMFKFGITNY